MPMRSQYEKFIQNSHINNRHLPFSFLAFELPPSKKNNFVRLSSKRCAAIFITNDCREILSQQTFLGLNILHHYKFRIYDYYLL